MKLFLSFAEDKKLAKKLIFYSYPRLKPFELYENCSLVKFLKLVGGDSSLLKDYSIPELKEKLSQLEEAIIKAVVWRF